MELKREILKMAETAKKAALILGGASSGEKDRAIRLMAKNIKLSSSYILRENGKDVKAAEKKKMKPAVVDRLTLNAGRIRAMVSSLEEVAGLDDAVGQVIQARRRPNGLLIAKVRVPIGVIGIIYEARPNVTADCAGLCIKSGNSVILKGAREALNSNAAIFKCIRGALTGRSVPKESVQFVASKDRGAVKELLKLNNHIDLIIPRGGEGLIREVAKNSRIPVIKHYKGVCHVYVDTDADLNMAHKIAMNAKVQRPGVCNAMETLLVHADVAARFLPGIGRDLTAAGVEIRGCKKTRAILKTIKAAAENDWYEEYLDLILAVKVVESLDEAVGHINRYGSNHSDAIVTDDYASAAEFLARVNSACVYANASTRFTDGYEFGMGAEIGISTDKLHARGPMGLEELTTYKYVILGSGQVRT